MWPDLLFPDGSLTRLFFNTPLSALDSLIPQRPVIFITDKNIIRLYPNRFPPSRTIVLPPGDAHKNLRTVKQLYRALMRINADRSAFLVGVGGGSVSDLTGFVAATFHRGLPFGFVPTTLLASVDAAVGGKNGYNWGNVKNSIGTVRQPDLILWDFSFFPTLPEQEWTSGFAEIIKHGAILSSAHLTFLEQHTPEVFRQDKELLTRLISDSVRIKADIVIKDHNEHGLRKLLNFGHTLGHAMERLYHLTHGEAVSLGMAAATILSEKYSSLTHEETLRLLALLQRYHLPVHLKWKPAPLFKILARDKKKRGDVIDLVLLESLGRATLYPLPLNEARKDLHDLCCDRP
jgi:3-dehydroquinate synthase